MIYMIVQSDDPQVVVDKVNKNIKEGWKPLGGVSISSWNPHGTVAAAITRYAQSMVKGN